MVVFLLNIRIARSFFCFLVPLILISFYGCQPESNGIKDNDFKNPAEEKTNVAKVYLLGVFHFGGSSADQAAMHLNDPFGKRRQDEIKDLVTRLAQIKPTKILVEYPKNKQTRLDSLFNNYRNGKDTLQVSETYQLGFRLAKMLGHSKLYAIDHKLNLPGDELFEYCQRNDKMHEFEKFISDINLHVASENRALDTLSISSYLAKRNIDSVDRLTNDTYIGKALSWGDSINEAGVHFAATWWERNFVILKNIAETIESKDDRLLIIIGSGHRAVLKDLIIDRKDMEYVEVGNLLN